MGGSVTHVVETTNECRFCAVNWINQITLNT